MVNSLACEMNSYGLLYTVDGGYLALPETCLMPYAPSPSPVTTEFWESPMLQEGSLLP